MLPCSRCAPSRRNAASPAPRRRLASFGVRLLTRTTRSVAPTDAGERLLEAIVPHLEGIETQLAALGALRDKPAGRIRITTGIDAAQTILWPALAKLLPAYPDIQVELAVQTGFVDMVAERFDAGVRLGQTIEQDMVAVRIGPDMRMAAVSSPADFASREPPLTPHDLARHSCSNLRFPTYGGLYAWEFERNGRALNLRVEEQVIVNEIALSRQAARDGVGIAYLPQDYVWEDIRAGVGRPRWLVELIRCRAGESADFELEACDDKGYEPGQSEGGRRSAPA
jgi:DNA-binding transcriptional LysR family regulator